MSKFLQATSLFVCVLVLVLIAVFCGRFPAESPAAPPSEPEAPVLDLNDNGGTKGLEYEMLENGTFGVRAGAAIDLFMIEIPETHHGLAVTEILDGAFEDAPFLYEVRIGGNVKHIGNRAFADCERLALVELPEKLEDIGEEAFSRCFALNVNGLTQAKKLKQIGARAFTHCIYMDDLVIPDSVIEIGESAFSYCRAMKKIMLGKNLRVIGDKAFMGSGLRRVNLPAGLIELGESAFADCTGLSQVTIGGALLELPSSVFEGCTALRVITMGNSVSAIGDYAFSGSSFFTLEIPEGVVSIGERAFAEMKDLECLILPRSLERVGACIYYGDVYYRGTEAEWQAMQAHIGYSSLYFYSEDEPEGEGYWHYVNGDAVLW